VTQPNQQGFRIVKISLSHNTSMRPDCVSAVFSFEDYLAAPLRQNPHNKAETSRGAGQIRDLFQQTKSEQSNSQTGISFVGVRTLHPFVGHQWGSH